MAPSACCSGHLNRNYEETPHIPVGVDNSFSPGPQDRGQPTHFYARRQSFVFRVTHRPTGAEGVVWTVNQQRKGAIYDQYSDKELDPR